MLTSDKVRLCGSEEFAITSRVKDRHGKLARMAGKLHLRVRHVIGCSLNFTAEHAPISGHDVLEQTSEQEGRGATSRNSSLEGLNTNVGDFCECFHVLRYRSLGRIDDAKIVGDFRGESTDLDFVGIAKCGSNRI